MINKNLIELQRNSKATCVVIETTDSGKLSPAVRMKASVSDKFLFAGDKPRFAEKVDEQSGLKKISYLVITGIDELSIDEQNRYVGLVKDREMNGYYLPENCIIVFTVKDKSTLKNISPDLYHFAVVAF